MSRLALAGAIATIAVVAFRVNDVGADLENQVFSSASEQLRIVVPRTWRATEQPSYPGVLLWMMHAAPEGRIALTSEPFTRAMFCAWPVACRASHESIESRLACALRDQLAQQHMKLGAVQAGPKDNDLAGMPSVWFEYDDGKKYLRQAVAIAPGQRAVSLVLSAPSSDARASLARPFDQALRTLRPLTPAETAAVVAANGSGSAAATAGSGDAGVPAASTTEDGGAAQPAAASDAGVGFRSAPASTTEDPIGPCR